MPYIAPELRSASLELGPELDSAINSIISIAKDSVPQNKLSGLANYIIST